jgi:hypothetical protein
MLGGSRRHRAGTPLLTLDLVPTGKSGEVRVYFRGQPLGGVKATLHAGRKGTKSMRMLMAFCDSKRSSLDNISSLCRITASRSPVSVGRPYQQTSHNAALSWRQQ